MRVESVVECEWRAWLNASREIAERAVECDTEVCVFVGECAMKQTHVSVYVSMCLCVCVQ
jgi:hypothetical protein